MDWTEAMDRARESSELETWIHSNAYDTYLFAERKHPSRRYSAECLPLDEVLWAKKPGQYLTKCPAHEDSQASLSLLIQENGSFVVNCFAGCDWREIQDYLKEHS